MCSVSLADAGRCTCSLAVHYELLRFEDVGGRDVGPPYRMVVSSQPPLFRHRVRPGSKRYNDSQRNLTAGCDMHLYHCINVATRRHSCLRTGSNGYGETGL